MDTVCVKFFWLLLLHCQCCCFIVVVVVVAVAVVFLFWFCSSSVLCWPKCRCSWVVLYTRFCLFLVRLNVMVTASLVVAVCSCFPVAYCLAVAGHGEFPLTHDELPTLFCDASSFYRLLQERNERAATDMHMGFSHVGNGGPSTQFIHVGVILPHQGAQANDRYSIQQLCTSGQNHFHFVSRRVCTKSRIHPDMTAWYVS